MNIPGSWLRGERARLLLLALSFGAGVVASACGPVGRQLAISAIDGCIEKHCRAQEGKARQQCTTACQRHYGR